MIRLTTEWFIVRDPVWADFPRWYRLKPNAKTMYSWNLLTLSEEESCQSL